MDLVLKSRFGGYFKYRIYYKTPDKVRYESSFNKNLIVDTGLARLSGGPIINFIKTLDLGISSTPPSASHTELLGPAFSNASLFRDLSALSASEVHDGRYSTYRVSFRTHTTDTPVTLREFVIKPTCDSAAFARQNINAGLLPSEGLEFDYELRVEWPCGIQSLEIPITYKHGSYGTETNKISGNLATNWYSVSSPEQNNWSSVVYGAEKFVAVSTDGYSKVAISTTGSYWVSAFALTANDLSGSTWTSIAYGSNVTNYGSRFVAVADSGTGGRVMASSNGTQWVPATAAANNSWEDITYGSGKFVAVASDGTYRVMTSTTSMTWTTAGSGFVDTSRWKAITHGANGFVAVALSGDARIMKSTTGVAWISAEAPEQNPWNDVTYGNGRYVAVALTGTNRIMTSTDATTWTAVSAPRDYSWQSVTYGDGLFVAVASDGEKRVMTSENGTTWTAVSAASAIHWKTVGYGNGTFVALASSGGNRVMYVNAAYDVFPTLTVAATGSYFDIPEDRRLFNTNYVLYTLSSIDLPSTCLTTKVSLSGYSTGKESNSYATQDLTLQYPNTAYTVYRFSSLSGFGSIKGMALNIGRTITNNNSAFWGFIWDVPAPLSTNSTVHAALYKPISSANTYDDLLYLNIAITHVWENV